MFTGTSLCNAFSYQEFTGLGQVVRLKRGVIAHVIEIFSSSAESILSAHHRHTHELSLQAAFCGSNLTRSLTVGIWATMLVSEQHTSLLRGSDAKPAPAKLARLQVTASLKK